MFLIVSSLQFFVFVFDLPTVSFSFDNVRGKGWSWSYMDVAERPVAPAGQIKNSAGYDGPIQWQFTGGLSAGAASRVSFHIRIE